MPRMLCHAFAAVLGVVALNSTASAQYQYPPTNPYAQVQPVAPPGYMLVPIPAGYGGQGPVQPASGCVGCANGSGYGKAAIPYGVQGAAGANGCGSCRSDLSFMFGSCKQFFDPCGPGACEGTHRFKGKGCASHPFARPYGTGYNGCTYDSYLNH